MFYANKKKFIVIGSFLNSIMLVTGGIGMALMILLVLHLLGYTASNFIFGTAITIGAIAGIFGGIWAAYYDRKVLCKRYKDHVKLVCSSCGSENLRHDADTQWDAKRQRFDLVAVYQHTACEDCEGETKVEEVPLYPELQ